MPEVLHESTGLRIVRNDVNRFAIATLHYTADPAKRSSEWEAEAKAGMSPAQFAKEYKIDYRALYGQRVFPEMATMREKIIIPEPYKEFGPLQVFWGGFDFGSRNPTSFHVYTIDEGVIQAIWELYEPCKNIPDLCAKLLNCPYYNQIKYIACDPTIVYQKSRTNKTGNFVTLAELMGDYGIRKLLPGHTDEAVWLAMMRKHWSDPSDPTFQIWSRCPMMIEEFDNAVYATQNDREILNETYKEEVEDIHNHSLDDCKYMLLSRPQASTNRKFKDPRMCMKWQH